MIFRLTRFQAWIVRSIFFFFWAAMGVLFPFLNIHYRNVGFSGIQIGWLSTLGPLLGIVSCFLFGVLYDRIGKVHWLLSILVIGSISTAYLIGEMCSFYVILIILCFYNFFYSPIVSLINSMTLSFLEGQRENYGLFRVWGTVGFIFTSTGGGFLIEKFGDRFIFIAFPLFMLIFLLGTYFLKTNGMVKTQSSYRKINLMLRSPAWVIFIITIFLVWFAGMGMLNFIGVTIIDMGGSTKLVGLAFTIAAITEIPLFIFSNKLLRKFGAAKFVLLSTFGYSLRLFLYSLMLSPEWVLWINALQLISYGPYWVGAVAYADEISTEELRGTGQGVLGAVMNLAAVISALISGWLFDVLGSMQLYLVLAGFAVSAMLLFGTSQILGMRRKQH